MTGLTLSLSKEELIHYVVKQVGHHFPDGRDTDLPSQLSECLDTVLERMNYCFSKLKSRYYRNAEGEVYFNHLNANHYCAFLYWTSNELYHHGHEDAATKMFMLNRVMFSIDLFYKIQLPDIFEFIHPVGAIIGNADYADYLVVYQGVTIGSLIEGKYPKFSEKTIVYSNSSVIGDCAFGQNCVVGARTYVIDTNLEDNKVILGNYPDNRIIDNKKPTIDYYFHFD